MPAQPFRYTAVGSSLSVEKDTLNVPDDGKYYLLDDGRILAAFSSKKQAVDRFRELLKERDYQPPDFEPEKPNVSDLDLEEYFYAKEMYWGKSHKYGDKGGLGH